MDDSVMPGHHVEAGVQPSSDGTTWVNHPTLVPAHVGPGEEGWFRSEFGCVAWSSFESMSGEMPEDQWGMMTPGAKNRNWNPSNVISTFFGTGAASAMSESGEVAFKRQLYQSMVGQLLFLKTEIEGWRSQNVWGTTFWMYNEVRAFGPAIGLPLTLAPVRAELDDCRSLRVYCTDLANGGLGESSSLHTAVLLY